MAAKVSNHITTPIYRIGAASVKEHIFPRRLAQEETTAFWALWHDQRTHFLHLSLRWMSGNRADAEDALSSAGIKASQYLATHPHEITNIKAWLTKLLFNHCMNLRKTNQREHRYVPLAFATDRFDEVATCPVQAPPEEAALRHEMQMYVRGNVNQLPPSLREPLVLYFFENMSQREVAAYLNLSYEVVRKRLQLARAILRKQMLPYVKHGEGGSVRTSVDTVEDIALRPAPVHEEITSQEWKNGRMEWKNGRMEWKNGRRKSDFTFRVRFP